ncbi:hypothetical protein J1605_006178 [Eschrichtius robustus]|uniref:Uncharacterized protein n=1 Tax=Eschrichtius robustus TaxID=9764 RepID=A0AB34H4Z5_ESCRO|nr:hypothetical protein J1605_006178 [Eschrichtius robustus]
MGEPLPRVPHSSFIPKAHSPPLGSRGPQERLVCAQRGSDVRIPNVKDGGEGLGIECLEVLERENENPKELRPGTSMVAQWLRTRLPVQGTWVQALVLEDPTCHGATKPVRHNYCACALEPTNQNY